MLIEAHGGEDHVLQPEHCFWMAQCRCGWTGARPLQLQCELFTAHTTDTEG